MYGRFQSDSRLRLTLPKADKLILLNPKRSLVGFLLFLSSDCQLSCAGLPVRSICCLKFSSNAAPVMSLNGLDDPAVIEAYQTALAEAGGW